MDGAVQPTVTTDRISAFVDSGVWNDSIAGATAALQALTSRTCEGAALTGWLDLPERMRGPELDRITSVAARLRSRHDALVVIGIGGSSLGARAALGALGHGAGETVSAEDAHPVVFAGHHLSADVLADTLASLEGLDYAVNVISKSGTTTEPGIAFRVFLGELRARHGESWRSRVVATTDAESGALRSLAREHELESFVVPNDVGGRFSVLSPVGLVPLAFAGVDVGTMLDGAAIAAASLSAAADDRNGAIRLAGARHALGASGYSVDVLSYTTPRLRHFASWWQQLFGESEGKRHRGAFPAVLEIPSDLHSLGQYMQEGARQVYETVLHVQSESRHAPVPEGDGRDELDYLAGRPLSEVLEAARRGTIDAHADGGVPVIEVDVSSLTPASVGATFLLFEVAVALGGALLEVNPFDQPGVEQYKTNMFDRLGKPDV